MEIADAQGNRALLHDLSRQVGFHLCGVAPVELGSSHIDAWSNWITRGHHGQMRYMERAERADIKQLAPWVKSVICVGLNYSLPEEQPGAPSGTVSLYAQGKDYHDVMKQKMEQLVEALRRELLRQSHSEFKAKIYVDTGAILERAYAEAAGLGWIGKNTCLINQQRGSWFFLGEILTNLEFASEEPVPDRCGTCTRCLDACPTGAFTAPYQLDARKCISYQTIELRGSIPEEDRAGIKGHIFGCDICQQVCPWNSSPKHGAAGSNPLPDFLPLPVFKSVGNSLLETLAQLSPEDFASEFSESPIRRTKYQGLLRNVAVALGNVGAESAVPALQNLAGNGDLVVREHAHWAMERIASRANPREAS